MSDREKAIRMFMRECGATSYRVQENGDIILTGGSGKEIVEHKVTAGKLSRVEECLAGHGMPLRSELQAILLGAKEKPRRKPPYKPDPENASVNTQAPL